SCCHVCGVAGAAAAGSGSSDASIASSKSRWVNFRLLTVDFSFEMDRKRRVLCVAARACRGFPHAIVLQPYVGRSGELRSTSLCWTGRYLTQQDSSAQKWALPLYNSCTKRCQNAGHYDFDTGSFRNLQAKHHTFVAH